MSTAHILTPSEQTWQKVLTVVIGTVLYTTASTQTKPPETQPNASLLTAIPLKQTTGGMHIPPLPSNQAYQAYKHTTPLIVTCKSGCEQH